MVYETERFIIQQSEVGPAKNFIYFVGDRATGEMAIVDPAWDVDFILGEVGRLGYRLTAVWLTHGHRDHVNALVDLLRRQPLPVYFSPHEIERYRPDLSITEGVYVDTHDGDTLELGDLRVRVLHTPGHSPGCQSFLVGHYLIAGDALFIDGCGRCDLPGSDVEAAYDTIHETLAALPDETVILPGHDYGPIPSDTLGNQRQSNRFLRATSKAEFIRERMG